MARSWLTTAREQKGWTQQEAARRLVVSQPYWSLLERGHRPVPARLLVKLQRHFEVPATEAPLRASVRVADAHSLAKALGALGYPGFSYVRSGLLVNPAALLLRALGASDLETRLVEALPWVVWQYATLDWTWLLERVKVDDLQNRLGFVVTLARVVAEREGDHAAVTALHAVEQRLEHARLARTDTLCRASMPQSERRWLKTARSREARHWNLLTDLRAEQLPYAS